jgi:drug/metabolite transporter (DMT)-like permease
MAAYMSYIFYTLIALTVLVATAYLLLSRKQTRDIVIWMKWPPPAWVFVLGAIVVIAAAAIFLVR